MAETTLTVQQIRDLGLWEKVCDFKGWEYTILAEGLINLEDKVVFDSDFKKLESSEVTDAQELATFLHSKLCRSNHTDACGWYYSRDDWSEYAHKSYLNKANKMLETSVEVSEIKQIIELAVGY